MEKFKRGWHKVPKPVRQLGVLIVGSLVVLAGVIMLATPGQGLLTIFLGLAILATEFVWAERLRARIVRKTKSAYRKIKPSKHTKRQH